MTRPDYRSQSFWHATAPGALEPRPALSSDEEVDVAIAGAGYTGLWTAWYLKQLEPGLRVAIVEKEIAGFGASGRNGGWCVGTLAGMDALLGDPSRRDGAIALQRELFDTVAEVERVCQQEGIDCHWRRSGFVNVATTEAFRRQLEREVAHWHSLGFGEEDVRWLDAKACAERVRTRVNLGGVFLAHCAAMHPARLVRGLAEAVERRGVAIYERTPALALERGAVLTPGGRLRARTVVRATEGYTGSIRGHRRALIPVHSMMIATEPLPEPVWKEIGLPHRETFADPRRMVIYGQRTADDRIAFGARGAYFYGSRVHDRFPPDFQAFRTVREILLSLLPVLAHHRIEYSWGGALGVPREWRPAVWLDRARGFATAGGYVGEGVAASNLAGRTLAELIAGRETPRTALPLVAPPSRHWEPEPLRFLGVTAVRRIGESLDAADLAGRPTPRLRGRVFDAFVRK